MYKQIYKLRDDVIRKKLMKKGAHPLVIEDALAKAKAKREAMHAEAVYINHRVRPWEELIAPLKVEIATALGTLNYRKHNTPDEHDEIALAQAYYDTLKKLLGDLRVKQKISNKTPLQLGTEQERPNRGEHWTDWVPVKIVNAILAEQERLVASKRNTRRKVLFPRRLISRYEEYDRKKMHDRIEMLIKANANKQAMIPNSPLLQDEAARLAQALAALKELSISKKCPRKWPDLLTINK